MKKKRKGAGKRRKREREKEKGLMLHKNGKCSGTQIQEAGKPKGS
jgi:hypothetical protein